MKRVLKWNRKLLFREWKTRLLLIGFLLFLSTFSLLYREQAVTLPESQLRSEYSDAHQIFRLIPDSHFEGDLGQEVQRRLGRNSSLIGLNQYILSQREGNTIEGLEEVVSDYLQNGREMAENNLFLHEATEFESHSILTSVYLPSINEVEQEIAFYNALEENDLDIEWNPYASSQIFQQQIELFTSVVLFIAIALLAGDHFTKDQLKNYSVTQGIPVSMKTQWRSRTFLIWLMTWTTALIGIAVSYGLSLFFETTGSLMYPVPVYFDQSVSYISLWVYGLLLIGLGMLVSYLFLMIINGLSWMIRNIYFTLLIVGALVLFPVIWSFVTPLTGWQPSFYTQIVSVVRGDSALRYQLATIEFWKMPIIAVFVWGLLEGVFHYVFKLIPTQTLGLKRRVSK